MFSFAEAMFSPMVNTAFGDLPGGRPLVEVFNLRQVGTTLGESSGSFIGGSLFLLARTNQWGWIYWASVAGLGIVVAVLHFKAPRGIPLQTPSDAVVLEKG